MLVTCVKVEHMSKMIQVRNVPEVLHREAKARAAQAGMSLSEYLLRELEQILAVPPVEEVLARIAGRDRLELSESPAQAVRSERELR